MKAVASLSAQLVLCFSVAAAAYSQGFGSLRGTIVDPSGAVVPDAAITLKTNTSDWTQTAKTDALARLSSMRFR
jgi:hypothetical protein